MHFQDLPVKEEFLSATREKLHECLRLFQKTAEYDQLYDACTTLLQVSMETVQIGLIIVLLFILILSNSQLYFCFSFSILLQFLL